MPNRRYFDRLDSLKQNGPVSVEILISALIEYEALERDEAQKVCRDWLKHLSAEWTLPGLGS